MWGIFEFDGSVHVVPVDEELVPKQPYMPHEFCICEPTIDTTNDRIIVIHKEEQ